MLCLWNAFLLSTAVLLAKAQAIGLASRYDTVTGVYCSLMPELDGLCQVKSMYGKSTAAGSYNGMLMLFGEKNCVVELEKCRKDVCYSWRDLTAQLPTDATATLTTGFFTNITIVSGATNAKLSRLGFSFKATSDKVSLIYSTQLCADFYRAHGRVKEELCGRAIEAITAIDAGSPISLDCS
mmetsp:Transcript_11088/g.23919  ORF Transcript_11088/g.23919 Transcript_11088/m.23919 type:complete len:182 (-) Transcript_11088:276-821(-)